MEGVFVFYLKLTGILFEYFDGRGKNRSNKTTELHADPLKKLSTSNMGIYSHHSLDRSKLIVAETSHRGIGGGSISEYVIV